MKRIRSVFAAIAALIASCHADVPRSSARAPDIRVDTGIDTGRITVAGGSLYWQSAGTGAPVVLIHGGNLDHRMWDAQFDSLRQHYRAIRYDARGFGRSSAADTAFSAPDDLVALLRALAIPRATLVGLSMGGGIAIDFALAHPEMVDRLVLAAPSVSGGVWPEDHDTVWLAAGRAAFARGDSIGLALAWLQSDYIRSALGDPAIAEKLRGILTDNAGHLMRRARDEDAVREQSPPAVNRLAELQMPTLLLVGGADTPLIRAMADTLATNVPRLSRIDLPGVGHMINLEAEQTFWREIVAFMSR